MPPREPISALDAHAGYWLRVVSNHVSHAFRRKVEAHSVTVAEWVVLRALFDSDAVNPSTLAETLGLTRGAVSKLADRLAAKGLVRCAVVKEDRRFQTLALTASGKRLVPVLAALADTNDRECFGHLSNADHDRLLAILRDLAHHHAMTSVPTD
jgi:DNA-binding MarR family transcriptional regulator